MKQGSRVVLGIKSHIGWGAVVALAGPAAEPRIVAKRRIDMATTFETGAVYHKGQTLPLAGAEAHVRRSRARFERLAAAAVETLVAELRGEGLQPFASALVSGSERPLPPLETILRSHALVHAAEGELYRSVLERACEACGLAVARVPAKELASRTAKALGTGLPALSRRLAVLGKASGKPWAVDQKESALAAWLTLASARAHGSR